MIKLLSLILFLLSSTIDHKVDIINQPVQIIREGLPSNTRHLHEGYWIGSFPNLSQIESLHRHGIRLIVTVTHVNPSTLKQITTKMHSLNITHLYIPIGSRFPNLSDKQRSTILNYKPNEIFVHCDHGADRSGVFIAYLLILRNNYSVSDALFSVVSRNQKDRKILHEILSDHGYTVNESHASKYAGNGGLKLRGDSYKRLVTTFLKSIRTE